MTAASTAVRDMEPADIDLKLERPKILIVDDRKENLVATRKILRRLDADIVEAASGTEALSQMLRNPFAVVLLDVQMPEMDGFETASLMQEDASMRNTPVIFVTAINKEEHYANHAAELGAVDYIFKPINPLILESKVRVYVNLYRQQQRIQRLNEVLSQNNEELERFAYICSHDLKEPARNILSFATLYSELDAKEKIEVGAGYVESIIKSSRRMMDLIQGVLDYSRIGGKSESFVEVDCGQILANLEKDFEHTIRERKVHIEYLDLPPIRGNRIQIMQLFQNLIGNGIKFNDKDNVHIRISCREKSREWEFSVADNGIGIDPRYHAKIFDMFQRLHNREEYPGSGIGLALCRRIVKLHNGRLWLQSEPGGGSTFFFTLPKNETDGGNNGSG